MSTSGLRRWIVLFEDAAAPPSPWSANVSRGEIMGRPEAISTYLRRGQREAQPSAKRRNTRCRERVSFSVAAR